MPNEAKPKPKKRNQFMEIAQQAAENAKSKKEREQEQADARKSPPQMGNRIDNMMRALWCPPQQ